MRRVFVSTWVVLGVVAAPAWAAGEPANAAAIDTLFAEIDAAFGNGDVEAILKRYSDHFLSDQPPHTKGDLRLSLKSLCGDHAKMSSRHELRERLIEGDRALVIARHERRMGDVVELDDVQYRLSAASGQWRILSRAAIPSDLTPPKPGEPFEIKAFGLRVTTPEKWHTYLAKLPPMAGDQHAAVRMESPDLAASMSVCVFSLPVPVAPKELAALCQNRISAMIPDSKFEAPLVLNKDGEYEVQIVWEQPHSEFAERSRIVMRQHKSSLIVAELSVHTKQTAEKYLPAFETLLSSLTLTTPQAMPPDQGRTEGSLYVNDVYGCRVTFPADWTLTQIRSFSFCTVASSPDGSGSVMFAGFRLPKEFGAEELIEADDAMTAELDETFERLERSTAELSGHVWQTSLTRTAAGGAARKRLRFYGVHGDVLYFFVCDALPPERFEEHRKTFESTVETFQILPLRPDDSEVDHSALAKPEPPKK